jgi:DNA segregation ATPase FtsK/SpoIIIE-like protein
LKTVEVLYDKKNSKLRFTENGEKIAAEIQYSLEQELTLIQTLLKSVVVVASALPASERPSAWRKQLEERDGRSVRSEARVVSVEGNDLTDEYAQDDDPLYQDAVRVVLEMGKASTSTLQRRLRLGYGRAARCLDRMQQEGIIDDSDGSQPRKVLKAPDWYR